jgi:hypothetical protein
MRFNDITRWHLLFFGPAAIIFVCTVCPVVAHVCCFARGGNLGLNVRLKSKVSESPRHNYAVAGFLFLSKREKWLKQFQ